MLLTRMIRFLCLVRLCCFGVLCVALTGSVIAQDTDPQLALATQHGKMRFDPEELSVAPGAKVTLVFKNTDEMQHNWVLCKPIRGITLIIAQKAWALGAQAMQKQFIPEDEAILFHSRVLNPQEADTVVFTAPSQPGDYPFVCTLPGHAFSMKGTLHVGTPMFAQKPGGDSKKGPQVDRSNFHLHVHDEPMVIRCFIDGGPPRPVAVGLPGGVNYCFNAETCAVEFGWLGMFLDVGPDRGYGVDRGGGWSKILGEKFNVGYAGCPLRFGTGGSAPHVRFLGYRRHGTPELLFEVEGVKVSQIVRAVPVSAGSPFGLQYDFKVEKPTGDLFVHLDRAQPTLNVQSTAGDWTGNVLRIPAAQAKAFTLTLVDTSKINSAGAKP